MGGGHHQGIAAARDAAKKWAREAYPGDRRARRQRCGGVGLCRGSGGRYAGGVAAGGGAVGTEG